MITSASERTRVVSTAATCSATDRSPATQANLDWVHQASSSSQTPASGFSQRFAMTSTSVVMAR